MLPREVDHHKRFQIDRIALFSDAVFAIAITLLIIEVKVPELERPVTDAQIGKRLIWVLPRMAGFVVSFYVIGLYWLVHHRMFGYVVGYNRRLLVNNLLFLFSIVLMPFSSALYSEYFITTTHIPMAVYVFNICFSGFMSYRLWKILGQPGSGLSQGLGNKILLRYFLFRSLMVPFVFILIFLLSLLFNQFAYFVTILVPLVNQTLINRFRKKHPGEFVA